jgi:hypothetical protein
MTKLRERYKETICDNSCSENKRIIKVLFNDREDYIFVVELLKYAFVAQFTLWIVWGIK